MTRRGDLAPPATLEAARATDGGKRLAATFGDDFLNLLWSLGTALRGQPHLIPHARTILRQAAEAGEPEGERR